MRDAILLELLYGPTPVDFDALAERFGVTREEIQQVDREYQPGDEDRIK